MTYTLREQFYFLLGIEQILFAEIEDEAPSGTGTRFSSTSLSFDNTNVKFDRVFT